MYGKKKVPIWPIDIYVNKTFIRLIILSFKRETTIENQTFSDRKTKIS